MKKMKSHFDKFIQMSLLTCRLAMAREAVKTHVKEIDSTRQVFIGGEINAVDGSVGLEGRSSLGGTSPLDMRLF